MIVGFMLYASTRRGTAFDRRNHILDAAMSVISRLGFHEARMDDIAQEAGLSKGVLYLYDKSKDAIIGAILRYMFAGELRQFTKLREQEGSASWRSHGLWPTTSSECRSRCQSWSSSTPPPRAIARCATFYRSSIMTTP